MKRAPTFYSHRLGNYREWNPKQNGLKAKKVRQWWYGAQFRSVKWHVNRVKWHNNGVRVLIIKVNGLRKKTKTHPQSSIGYEIKIPFVLFNALWGNKMATIIYVL